MPRHLPQEFEDALRKVEACLDEHMDDTPDAEPVDLRPAWGYTVTTGSDAKLAKVLRIRRAKVQQLMGGNSSFTANVVATLFEQAGGMAEYKKRVGTSMKRQKTDIVNKAGKTIQQDDAFAWAKCDVSMDLIKDPMIIVKCGHTFDKKSLHRLTNTRRVRQGSRLIRYARCPRCRGEFSNPGDLCINYALKDALTWIKKLPRGLIN